MAAGGQMKFLKLLLLASATTLLVTGCLFTRTVYVPHGQAVRLAEPIDNAAVWVKTSDGETVRGNVDLPEGWFCLPDPGEE